MPKLLKYFPWEWLLLSAVSVAVILRIINLESREFWYDEVLSLLLVTGQKKLYQNPSDVPILLANYKSLLSLPIENSFGDVLQTGEKLLKGLVAEPHPPLFYLGQHLWLRLFGNSVAAMRSLPVVYSIGAISCSYGLGRHLLGHRGGLLLAALLGLNPFYLFHSLNVRMYCSLVFWTVLSGWAILETIKAVTTSQQTKKVVIWSLILVFSVTAGFMTFYYFLFWVASLGVLVLLLDRKRWLYYGFLLSTGILITTPWLLWGTRQQLNNADLNRFAASGGLLATTWQHLEEMLQTFGNLLLIGDWANILPPVLITVTGVSAVAIAIGCGYSLVKHNQRQILFVAFIFGILPLLMMVAVDVISGKFTVGFGFGRSLIFILPGCLLLIAAWIEKASGKWQTLAAVGLLFFYLTVGTADFSLRHRWMFQQIADIIEQEPAQTSLIVMNSHAWGHVLRLAYYLPSDSSVMLLAQPTTKLIPALANTLTTGSQSYSRLLWLKSDRPVWGKPATTIEKQQIDAVLAPQFQLVQQQRLLGTWELDHFTASLYQHR
ncbi:hypothetical protein Sta7437_4120 [Stanieria cyanosphaera PCC 7437]|uniref:Glycosyltransferase RgtA/B/C/D-like domain-containing protein n=1 Tax=Stanieria cyanosphaera (strain ATCC 29371 / PCC 7437) TaxID=111780 RepID=K9Y0Z2_STAC7|nr:glycosyltransferase family 39 protein [Stanieria cyanosphaera]AFZ37597.1 hypothetical protein Sta7437_4120 [Stanieria cyanosphaera PCC 7437]